MIDATRLEETARNLLIRGEITNSVTLIVDSRDAKILSIILGISLRAKNEEQRQISQATLSNMMGSTPSVIAYRFTRFCDNNLMRRKKNGGKVIFKISPPSAFTQEMIDRAEEILSQIIIKKGVENES